MKISDTQFKSFYKAKLNSVKSIQLLIKLLITYRVYAHAQCTHLGLVIGVNFLGTRGGLTLAGQGPAKATLSVGWKGSRKIAYCNLPLNEGLSLSLVLVCLGFVWCNFFKTSRMGITWSLWAFSDMKLFFIQSEPSKLQFMALSGVNYSLVWHNVLVSLWISFASLIELVE